MCVRLSIWLYWCGLFYKILFNYGSAQIRFWFRFSLQPLYSITVQSPHAFLSTTENVYRAIERDGDGKYLLHIYVYVYRYFDVFVFVYVFLYWIKDQVDFCNGILNNWAKLWSIGLLGCTCVGHYPCKLQDKGKDLIEGWT